jgi:hypothetical protein
MKIADKHVTAIQSLGYTADESRFLYIVATHSGYFVTRQFIAFTGDNGSRRPRNFTEKLESRGHVTWREYLAVGGVYHLFSRTLYRQIDRDNLRHHQGHSSEFIRTRLLQLDFILANHAHDYFEMEHDKVRFFCDELGIPREALPAKAYQRATMPEPTLRYFVDRFPLFLDASAGSASPLVTLSYVDAGLASLASFANHLNAYTPLFRHLARFRFLYIAPSPLRFVRAERRFSALVTAPLEEGVGEELERYFRLRAAWEGKQYAKLTTNDIEWLDQAHERLASPRIEQLYAAWGCRAVGEQEWRALLKEAHPLRNVEFRACLVTAGHQAKGKEMRSAG